LSAAERRRLLAQLDEVPNGWRRCALAFLEAQSWKQELGALVRQPSCDAGILPAKSVHAGSPHHKRLPRIVGVLAAAATLLVAVGVGFFAREMGLAERGLTGEYASTPASDSTAPTLPGSPTALDRGAWQTVNLMPRGSEYSDDTVRLPAIERPSIDHEWLNSFPDFIPPEVREALERTGHEVQNQRRLMPMPMRDGRQLVVPVDQVEIRYRGDPAYQ
jgi:hypothetical protein